MSEAGRDLKEAVQRKASFRQTVSAVAWRKGGFCALDEDVPPGV